jgi:hypothetical protein
LKPEPDLKFIKKVQDLLFKFGFKDKQVIIEEEDPSSIQLTTKTSIQTIELECPA